MAKKKRPAIPDEQHLHLPSHPELTNNATPIVDTHTHLLSTFGRYRTTYPTSSYQDIFSFVKGMYKLTNDSSTLAHRTSAIVDVWCEAPVIKAWREVADSALSESDRRNRWGGIDYWFVMGECIEIRRELAYQQSSEGVHPHEAERYTDEVEREIVSAMEHPRCVGWGEIGLDYKNSTAPREIQHSVLRRQLRHAVMLGKPITIHTREAETDTERILKSEVPKDHPIHVHCFTDSPELALRLTDHFPNLYIGITGVITYTSNLNTANLVRALAASPAPTLRILLETDAPYMVPSNIYRDLRNFPAGSKLPISHTGMIPWTAEWVAKIAAESTEQDVGTTGHEKWSVERVMREARENARKVYGV